jgi:GH24 family phage-related lysozyme (muramidase)
MLTDHKLEEFLFISEGGNRLAYDDFNPRKKLKPGDEIEGTLTYGPGFTTREDGSPVQIGDSMTDQEAYDRLRKYIREEVEPVLEDLIHVPIATSLANALGSLVFNFGADEVYGWRLWGRINSGEPAINIVNEWVDGTFSSKGVPLLGLLRRRFKELGLAFNLEWRAGDNIDWDTDPEEFLQILGWDGAMPKPEPIIDSDLFNEDPGANEVKPDTSDPTPETPMTMDDSQYVGYVAAVGDEQAIPFADFMAHRTLVTERNAIKAPKVDVKKESKALEDSETANGFAKEVSGKDDVRLAAIMSGAATTAGLASTTSDNLSKTMENTQTMFAGLSIMQLVWVGLLIGLPLLGYGLWKMHRGKLMKDDGRAKATRTKV